MVGSVAVGSVASAQAAATPKVTGKALITFDAGFGPLVAAISPIAPAKFYGAKLGFPVTSASGSTISLGGAIGLPTVGVPQGLTSPTVKVTSAALKTGSFTVVAPLSGTQTVAVEIFALTHFTKKVTGKTTVWTGDVQLTRSPGNNVPAESVAGLFTTLAGKTVSPGDKLGRIEITVNSK